MTPIEEHLNESGLSTALDLINKTISIYREDVKITMSALEAMFLGFALLQLCRIVKESDGNSYDHNKHPDRGAGEDV